MIILILNMDTFSLYRENFKQANIFFYFYCQHNSKMCACLCASARSIRVGRNSRKASNIMTASICREAKNYRDLVRGEVKYRLASLWGILFI
jgi:hypothetical protein